MIRDGNVEIFAYENAEGFRISRVGVSGGSPRRPGASAALKAQRFHTIDELLSAVRGDMEDG